MPDFDLDAALSPAPAGFSDECPTGCGGALIADSYGAFSRGNAADASIWALCSRGRDHKFQARYRFVEQAVDRNPLGAQGTTQGRCPFCDTDGPAPRGVDVESGGEVEGVRLERRVFSKLLCRFCRRSWSDVYEFVGIEEDLDDA